MSIPLTFKELQHGFKFIAFPTDGDDAGHGGYRNGSYIYTKVDFASKDCMQNAIRSIDGTLATITPDQKVLSVI